MRCQEIKKPLKNFNKKIEVNSHLYDENHLKNVKQFAKRNKKNIIRKTIKIN